jgi:hypothetical protein
LVPVSVGVAVELGSGVAVHSGVGVVARHTPEWQVSLVEQHAEPHDVVPTSQAHRRRPNESGDEHVPEQQSLLPAHMTPPGRQRAADPLSERKSPAPGTAAPSAAATPRPSRFSTARRLPPVASAFVRSSNCPPSISVILQAVPTRSRMLVPARLSMVQPPANRVMCVGVWRSWGR